MSKYSRLIGWIILLTLVGGCAGQKAGQVILLPQASQATGAVLVTTDKESFLLDSGWQSAQIKSNGKILLEDTNEQEVKEIFGQALDALPPSPEFVRIYFLNDTTEIDPRSNRLIVELLETIATREVVQIEITGHTDTLGSESDNDNLSIQRAIKIRVVLVRMGLDPSSIRISGRGERELLVQTEDEVSEPSNRRVEITIR